MADFCPAYASAVCARERDCRRLDETELAVCIASAGASCSDNVRKVNAGSRTFDGVLASRCVQELPGHYCVRGGQSLPASCVMARIFGPGGGEGSTCETSSDCDAGYCPPLGGCRTCTALKAQGEVCTSLIRCAQGFYCPDGVSDGGTGDGGARRCSGPAELGDPCSPSFPCREDVAFCPSVRDGGPRLCQALMTIGQPCSALEPCEPNAFCPSVTDGGARSCEPLRTDGTPCTSSAQCQSRYCNAGHMLDGGSNSCGYVAQGLPCAGPGDCGPGQYCKGLTASVDAGRSPGRCTARIPDGGPCVKEQLDDGCANPGESCLGGACLDPSYDLPPGAECDASGQCSPSQFCPNQELINRAAHCTDRVGEDAGCFSTSNCMDGLYCEYRVRKCVALVSAGAPCPYGNCKAFLTCVATDAGNHVCVAPSAAGGPCASGGTICANGSWCPFDGGPCQAKLPVGSPCTGAVQCASGRCSNPDGGNSDRACLASCFP